jgi:hypothetical protein
MPWNTKLVIQSSDDSYELIPVSLKRTPCCSTAGPCSNRNASGPPAEPVCWQLQTKPPKWRPAPWQTQQDGMAFSCNTRINPVAAHSLRLVRQRIATTANVTGLKMNACQCALKPRPPARISL